MSRGSIINHEPFFRLRWKVFGDIGDILVEEREEGKVKELLPFENYPITKEPATHTGLTSLEINIEDLEVRESNDRSEEDTRFYAPAPLKIENDKGHLITVGDVVGSLHKYLNTHKVDIVETINDIAGDEAVVEVVDTDGNALPSFDESRPLFFNSLSKDYQSSDGQHIVSVVLIWEGELGMSLEDTWKIRGSEAYDG
jgi:hypothetical protein